MAKAETAKNVDIAVSKTKQIALPDGMSIGEAITWLQRKKTEAEQVVQFVDQIKEGYSLDALVAFHASLAEIYGFTNAVPTPGFFGPRPPAMLNIEVGPGEYREYVYGQIQIPGIVGTLGVSINDEVFYVSGEIQRGGAERAKEIMELTRKKMREQSLYRGKAVKVSWSWKRGGEGFNPLRDAPKFLDLSKAIEPIYSEDVANSLELALFTPIERADYCRQYGVPLKRGVLLNGKYGVGKSETARFTALKAMKHGWTYLYLDSIEDLESGLKMAGYYSPAVLFVEDVDRAFSGERDVDKDRLLNLLDGIDTKAQEVIIVFTTNHLEKIHKAFIRPGRLDTLVTLEEPDAYAAGQLVAMFGGKALCEGFDLATVGAALAGRIPAVIREVTERAKIAAIRRIGKLHAGGLNGYGIEGAVTESDVLDVAKAMESHIRAIEALEQPKVDRELVLRVDSGCVVQATGRTAKAETDEKLEGIEDRVGDLENWKEHNF